MCISDRFNIMTSQYDIISDMGPVLTFNTYNAILHYFTEPKGSSDVDGMAGDYEFVFMDVKPEMCIRDRITSIPLCS